MTTYPNPTGHASPSGSYVGGGAARTWQESTRLSSHATPAAQTSGSSVYRPFHPLITHRGTLRQTRRSERGGENGARCRGCPHLVYSRYLLKTGSSCSSITYSLNTLCHVQAVILGAHGSRAVCLKLTSVRAAIASGQGGWESRHQVGGRCSLPLLL